MSRVARHIKPKEVLITHCKNNQMYGYTAFHMWTVRTDANPHLYALICTFTCAHPHAHIRMRTSTCVQPNVYIPMCAFHPYIHQYRLSPFVLPSHQTWRPLRPCMQFQLSSQPIRDILNYTLAARVRPEANGPEANWTEKIGLKKLALKKCTTD